MKRIFFAIIALFATVMNPMAARAASGERISNFVTAATLEASGALNVDETITYNFGDTSHHGIYRTIPTQYQSDSGTTYRPTLKFGSATMDGAPANTDVSNQKSSSTLKIGDANVLISGIHTYQLHYTLSPIVQASDKNDSLKLNLTGNSWEVPIDHVSATINLGVNAVLNPPNCFVGMAGSKETACTIQATGSVVTASTTRGLEAGEGISVFTDLPTGSVQSHLEPYVAPTAPAAVKLIPPVLYLAILMAVIAQIRKMFKARQIKHSQTIIPEYEAPAGFSPAQLGLLNDDRAGLTEITATLIDLAVRGHLKITQTQAKKLFVQAEYRFDRLETADTLQPYEQQLLDAMFGSSQQVMLSHLSRSDMAETVSKINTELGEDLTKRGLYLRSPGAWRIAVPFILLFVAFGALNFGSFFVFLSGEAFFLLPFAAFMVVAMVFIGIAWYLIRQPYGLTAEGAKSWAAVRGFKSYLTVAEKDRLNFSDAPAKTPELFNKLLPAAVALGVETQWAKQFEGIDVMKSAGWYAGSNLSGLTAATFASSLGSDFSSGISQNFTPVSSSSSSGGGMSGGGFSGGGGGSW